MALSSPASSRLSSRASSPLSPASLPSAHSVPATPGANWSPRPGVSPINIPRGSLPVSTDVSPSWSPAQGSLLLLGGLESPPPSPHSSAELVDEPIPEFPDTNAVENQIFRVHRHFLARDSVYFQELFAGPFGEFGCQESEAIPLEDIGIHEFECLLDFFYTGMYGQSNFSLGQWITLLSISTRLTFDLLRTHAIQAIEENPTPLDPIDKLVLAMKYKIPQWLAPAYTELCQRPNCLEEWEAEKIGLKNTVRIARAREAFKEASLRSRAVSPVFGWRPMSPTLQSRVDYQAMRAARIVDEVFFPFSTRTSTMDLTETPASQVENVTPAIFDSQGPGTDPEIPKNNKKYYFDDDLSIFSAGNQRFKVHRHFLRKESEHFKGMFTCPPPPEGPDGTCDERPIPLYGVTPAEFEALLDFFYEEKFQRSMASTQEWINLLSISTRYVFQRVREAAIRALDEPLPSVDRIVLAEKHDIPHWLRIAYVEICERSKPLSGEEAEKIGARKTAMLAQARETVRNPHHQVASAPPSRIGSPMGYAPSESEDDAVPKTPENGFYHNRHRVDCIVSEVFFPPGEV
ncbi:BTB domain-containing protein [Favolaschia claudopus]|uniref:BTB domain-containing protein n=1 Tax=Favolaschia claudopus TaxID=2862362 RepID=A0AAW0CVC7_9AGAR